MAEFDRAMFAARLRALIGDVPRELWAERHGLSYGSVKDLVQGRVNPSRAVMVLVTAIENDEDFMREIATLARDDLAALSQERTVRNKIGEFNG